MSKLATELIELNKSNRAKKLDLGNCGLSEVPAEVGELDWLESLNFSSAWFDSGSFDWRSSANNGSENSLITGLHNLCKLKLLKTLVLAPGEDISPLAQLIRLRTLTLSDGKVSDIAPLASLSALQGLSLSGTDVRDLTPLSGLHALRSLKLNRTKVRNLGPLGSLSALRSLDLSETTVRDILPLSMLKALELLSLSGTQVSSVIPLASLSALRTLYLYGTRVRDVSPLAALSKLKALNLNRTQVSDLSPLAELIRIGARVQLRPQEGKEAGIYVQNCPLTNPPLEIVQQGNGAIINYFAELGRSGVDRLYEAKMLIVGEGGSGKTSLLRRLYQGDQPLPKENESTKGIAIHRHSFQLRSGRAFRLNVWDFGGQEIYHATHQFFLTNRSLYVLVDDTRKDDKSVQDPLFRYWLSLIDVFGSNSPVLIFQNEKGGRSKQIDFDGIKSRYTNVREKHQGDLKNKRSVGKLRDAIEYFAQNLSHIGEELPAPWISVRADIEQRAAREPYISQEEYFNIYKRHLMFDESRALFLSQYLHDLGVFLHFQKDILLKDTVILQNEWATQAVFRILDDEAVKKRLGRFGEDDCVRIWRESVYSQKHAELLALMKKFELCYELPDMFPREWLAPQLLPPAMPFEVKDWHKQNDLVLRYKYDFLPKGIVSRLTVRMHRFVKRPEMAWTTGVLFERDATAALVELLPDGQHIEIRARGPEAMGLISAVSFDLDALNESFQGLQGKVKRLVPCPCEICAKAETSYFFEYGDLVRRLEHGKVQVECGKSYQEMEAVKLLYKLPGWAKGGVGWDASAQVLRIFLASSSELRDDRDAFELHMRQQNDDLRSEGVYLEVVRWENFLDAISQTRLQDEYNRTLRGCDVFVALFATKAGKFTDEEFDVALGEFKATGKPIIFTYFKNAEINIRHARPEDLRSLWAFQDKLKSLGHYQTNYENTADLKLQFGDQLRKLIAAGRGMKSRSTKA